MSQDLKQAIQSASALLRELDEAGTPPLPTKIAARLSRHAGVYPIPNIVVDACDQRFAEATEQALKDGQPQEVAKYIGRIAYCATMPKLSGASNIRDFIACVSHAMALGILPGNEGTRLLYAAQVAHMALTKRPKKRNKSSHAGTAVVDKSHQESTR
jgi:hypothetical protein